MRRPERGRIAVPSLIAGGLMALSLPPWGWWPLALLGAALLYWRLAGLRLRNRLWAGWLAGLGCCGPGLMWARTFNWYGAVILILLEALFVAAAAMLTPAQRGRAPAFIAASTVLEACRMTWPFGGLPIGGVFLGQADGPLLQLARLGGPLLLTAGVYAGGVGLATLLAARRPGRGLAILGGLALLTLVAATLPDGGAPVRSITVATVQGGGRRGVDKADVSPATVLFNQLAAMEQVARRRPAPDLVLWPEDVIGLDIPLPGSSEATLMSQTARQLKTTLVVGITEPAGQTKFRNEIVAWGPSGRVVATFEKVHRVPFGEYVPYRSLIGHLADISGVPADAIPGHGTGLLHTPAGPLGTLVSFEVFYANRSRTSVRAGAQLLIVPTNTSSYVTAQVPTQEVAADAVQAVETGRDLVQSAPTGYSTVVTHRGVVLRRSVLAVRQDLFATVPLRRGFTPYDHLGDLPYLVLFALIWAAGWRRERRAQRRVETYS
ncbi:MAG TPA: apolipoprotein N-acyltransferase [Acidimicrobiales bacterium]|nr:apolipoprotein N-acyltransferase [Acidimicrobiales bacterium]